MSDAMKFEGLYLSTKSNLGKAIDITIRHLGARYVFGPGLTDASSVQADTVCYAVPSSEHKVEQFRELASQIAGGDSLRPTPSQSRAYAYARLFPSPSDALSQALEVAQLQQFDLAFGDVVLVPGWMSPGDTMVWLQEAYAYRGRWQEWLPSMAFYDHTCHTLRLYERARV